MKLELAKVGLADNGQQLTQQDIRELVDTFSEIRQAPVVLGHRQADHMPAFGHVTGLEASEGTLYGEVELTDPLQEAYSEGYYRGWSIGARRRPKDGKLYLHHLAILGAQPPAIKGLEVVSMADDDLVRWDFADDEGQYQSAARTDWPIADIDWNASDAVDRIVEKGGYDLLSQTCAAYELQEGDQDPPRVKARYHFPYGDVIDGEVHVVAKAVSSGMGYLNGARGVEVDRELDRVVRPVLERLEQRIEEEKDMGDKSLEQQVKDLQAQLESKNQEVEDLKSRSKNFGDQEQKVKDLSDELTRVQRQLKDQKKEELREAAQGRLPKQQLESLMELADRMDNQPLEFSDKSQKEPIEVLKSIFANLPQPVEEGRLDLGDPPREGEGVDVSEMTKNF